MWTATSNLSFPLKMYTGKPSHSHIWNTTLRTKYNCWSISYITQVSFVFIANIFWLVLSWDQNFFLQSDLGSLKNIVTKNSTRTDTISTSLLPQSKVMPFISLYFFSLGGGRYGIGLQLQITHISPEKQVLGIFVIFRVFLLFPVLRNDYGVVLFLSCSTVAACLWKCLFSVGKHQGLILRAKPTPSWL